MAGIVDDYEVNLFVYGTLMRGFSNHQILMDCGADFQSFAQTLQRYRMISFGGFPGVVKMPDQHGSTKNILNQIRLRSLYAPVEGELYKVPYNNCIRSFTDILEGHPDFYQRQWVSIYDYAKSQERPSYMYILTNTNMYGNLFRHPSIALNEDDCFNWGDHVRSGRPVQSVA